MSKTEIQFYQLIRIFLTEYLPRRRNLSDLTVKTYKQSLNLLRKYFSEEQNIPFSSLDFSHITRENVYNYLLWLRDDRGCSYNTLNLRLAALKSFLKFCSEEDISLTAIYHSINQIKSFKLSINNEQIQYLSTSQLQLLFSIPKEQNKIDRRNRFIMIFIYETGLRIQELLDLNLSSIIQIDSHPKVRVLGKGNRVRYIPLMEPLQSHLNEYLAEFHEHEVQNAEIPLFFTIHSNTKTRMRPGTIDYFLKKYAKIAIESDKTFPKNLHAHTLRHSIAMTMYNSGIPISYIRDFLGHKSIETTAIYAHANDETIFKTLESLDSLRFPGYSKEWKDQEDFLIDFCGLT